MYLINQYIHPSKHISVSLCRTKVTFDNSFYSTFASVEEWSEWVLYADKIHLFVPIGAEILLL